MAIDNIDEDPLIKVQRSKLPALRVIMVLSHVISLLFTFFVLYSVVPGSTFFSWHPSFEAVGYAFFMYEAILMFSPSALFVDLKKQSKITFHWVLQVLALSCAVLGSSVAFYNKILNNKEHFVSWHSKLGLVTNICAFNVALGGVMTRYPSKFKVAPPLTIKTMHACAACATFILSCATIITGLNSNYFNRIMSGSSDIWRICMLLPPLLCVTVVIQVVKSYIPKYGKR